MLIFILLLVSCKANHSIEEIERYSIKLDSDSLEHCYNSIEDLNKKSFFYCLKNFGTNNEKNFFNFIEDQDSFIFKEFSNISYETFKQKVHYYLHNFIYYQSQKEEFLKQLSFFQTISIKDYFKKNYWKILYAHNILSLEEILKKIQFFSKALQSKDKLSDSILKKILKTYSIEITEKEYFDSFLKSLHSSHKDFTQLSILEKKFSLKYKEIIEYLDRIYVFNEEFKKKLYPPSLSVIFCQKSFSLFYTAIHSENREEIKKLEQYLLNMAYREFLFSNFLELTFQEKSIYFASYFVPLHLYSQDLQEIYNHIYSKSTEFFKEIFSK